MDVRKPNEAVTEAAEKLSDAVINQLGGGKPCGTLTIVPYEEKGHIYFGAISLLDEDLSAHPQFHLGLQIALADWIKSVNSSQ